MNLRSNKCHSFKTARQDQTSESKHGVRLPLLNIRPSYQLTPKLSSSKQSKQSLNFNIRLSKSSLIELVKYKQKAKQLIQQSPLALLDYQDETSKQNKLDISKKSKINVLSRSTSDLIEASVKILQTSVYSNMTFGYFVLKKTVTLIANNYNQIPYHNFAHAFSLTYLNYQCLMKQPSVKYLFTEEQYFYVLIAGLAHDLNHPGTNNLYQIKIKSLHAQLSNGVAVLENMHIRTLWKIFRQNPDCDLVLKSQDSSKARQIITRLILATDMACHTKKLVRLKQLKVNSQQKLKKSHDDRWFFMEQLFHACDLGNSISDYQEYIKWGVLLAEEFNNITQLEALFKVEVTAIFKYKGVRGILEDQVWFVGYMVYPLWKEITQICPLLSPFLNKIQKNLERVKQELKCIKQQQQIHNTV